MENDRGRVGCLDLVDHQVVAGARAQHPVGRKDNSLKARGYIGSGQWRTVVKFDVLSDLESVGLAVIRRPRHLGAEIADEIRGRGGVLWVDPDQHAVEG